MSIGGRRSVDVGAIAAYYLATPLFALADVVLSLPLRVAGLPGLEARLVYYGVLIGLGLLCRARPVLAPWVGMAESSVNLLLLLSSVLLPIWNAPETVMSGAEVDVGLTGASLVNVLVVGVALVLSFHRHRRAATEGTSARGPRDGA